MSFPCMRESTSGAVLGIPAYAGMTLFEVFQQTPESQNHLKYFNIDKCYDLLGIVTLTVVPLPFELTTDIEPFIESTEFLTIDIPKPEPSLCLALVNLWNLSYRNCCSSSGIPMPWSDTINSVSESKSFNEMLTSVFSSEYFNALVIRLDIIWFNIGWSTSLIKLVEFD